MDGKIYDYEEEKKILKQRGHKFTINNDPEFCLHLYEEEGENFVEKLPHHKVKDYLRNSDIVIDQLLMGWHGVFALEAMASGKPVLCYIREDLKKYSPELPILSTSPENIYGNLKLLIEKPNLRQELRRKGRKYVEKYHDSKKNCSKDN